ncbi:MAG: hypothetical protein LBR37_02980 [Erysipelotrichaceae bacterium]|jgi:Flp pilus assembly protein TadB|nr:hypothetical protein [Erysipelotrichaceae bacterium]
MRTLISITIAVIISLYAFTLTSNLVFTAGVLVLQFILCFFLFGRIIMRSKKKVRMYETAFSFIDSFLLHLSNYRVVKDVLENRKILFDQELNAFLDKYQEYDDNTKLIEIANFYHVTEYQIFLALIKIYEENGGEILRISNRLVEIIAEKSTLLSDYKRKSALILINNIILTVLTFLILILCRFLVTDLYRVFFSTPLFLILLAIFLAGYNLVAYLYIKKLYKLEFLYEKN